MRCRQENQGERRPLQGVSGRPQGVGNQRSHVVTSNFSFGPIEDRLLNGRFTQPLMCQKGSILPDLDAVAFHSERDRQATKGTSATSHFTPRTSEWRTNSQLADLLKI